MIKLRSLLDAILEQVLKPTMVKSCKDKNLRFWNLSKRLVAVDGYSVCNMFRGFSTGEGD